MQTGIKLGTIVRLWCDAANYGIVTKLNKKTFVVLHNAGGRTLYRYDSKQFRDYLCKDKVFRCSVISDAGLLYAARDLSHSYIFNRLEADLQKKIEEIVKRG